MGVGLGSIVSLEQNAVVLIGDKRLFEASFTAQRQPAKIEVNPIRLTLRARQFQFDQAHRQQIV